MKLPVAGNTKERKEEEKSVTVAIKRNGEQPPTTFLGGKKVDNPADLVKEVKERLEDLPDGAKMIFLKADEELEYAEVMKVMDLVREAGVEEISLIAEKKVRNHGTQEETRPAFARRLAARPRRNQVRHQHHAAHRRDARPPDHLHGRHAARPARSRHRAASTQPEHSGVDTAREVEPGGARDRRERHVRDKSPVASLEELDNRLKDIFQTRSDKTIFVKASGKIPYGRVIQAMDIAKGAGVERIGIISEKMAGGETAAPGGPVAGDTSAVTRPVGARFFQGVTSCSPGERSR